MTQDLTITVKGILDGPLKELWKGMIQNANDIYVPMKSTDHIVLDFEIFQGRADYEGIMAELIALAITAHMMQTANDILNPK